jgi:DNA-binding XRE family transcriptional regulator
LATVLSIAGISVSSTSKIPKLVSKRTIVAAETGLTVNPKQQASIAMACSTHRVAIALGAIEGFESLCTGEELYNPSPRYQEIF